MQQVAQPDDSQRNEATLEQLVTACMCARSMLLQHPKQLVLTGS